MSVQGQTPSAKSFREPLLLTLGELTYFKDGVPVSYDRVYDPIFSRMNIDRAQYGVTDNDIPWVERWVQFAFKDLCEQGLGARHGRGRWGLTPDGVRAASALSGTTSSVVPVGAAPITPPPVVQPQVLPAPVPKPDTQFLSDPYILGLVASKMGCMGALSEQAPTCKDCALQNLCSKEVQIRLLDIAVTLDAEDNRKATARPKSAAVPAPAPVVAPAPPVAATPSAVPTVQTSSTTEMIPAGTGVLPAGAIVNEVPTKAQTPCRRCRQIIPVGERGVWVYIAGSNARGRGSAMYHKPCFKEEFGRDP
jgi:hypothetical protein